MRLLNLKTFQLHWFHSAETAPQYAILSHTWGTTSEEPEVLFQDWGSEWGTVSPLQEKLRNVVEAVVDSGGSLADLPEGEKGKKLVNFCLKARKYGLEYGWVDTLCIDKSSSAELSEAINSMWKYYRQAAVCIAFLADLKRKTLASGTGYLQRHKLSSWTLQELLAPETVSFFNAEWKYIGSRAALAGLIAKLTYIPETILSKGYPVLTAGQSLQSGDSIGICVAQRMSWASKRETTRAEDMAYSLMGLFGVNMPILYGEGFRSAFYRLQVEILQATGDYSFLAWGVSISVEDGFQKRVTSENATWFAQDLQLFSSMASISHIPNYNKYWDQIPHSLPSSTGVPTHTTGLRLSLAIIPASIFPDDFWAYIPVTEGDDILEGPPPKGSIRCMKIRINTMPTNRTDFFRADLGLVFNDNLEAYFVDGSFQQKQNFELCIRDVFIPARLPTDVVLGRVLVEDSMAGMLSLKPAFAGAFVEREFLGIHCKEKANGHMEWSLGWPQDGVATDGPDPAGSVSFDLSAGGLEDNRGTCGNFWDPEHREGVQFHIFQVRYKAEPKSKDGDYAPFGMAIECTTVCGDGRDLVKTVDYKCKLLVENKVDSWVAYGKMDELWLGWVKFERRMRVFKLKTGRSVRVSWNARMENVPGSRDAKLVCDVAIDLIDI